MSVPRFRLVHLVSILVSISILIYLLGGDSTPSLSSPAALAAVLSFCPYSTSQRHIPTIILQGDALNDRNDNRTHFVGEIKSAPFLPYAYPPRDLRIAQHISDSSAARAKPGRGHLEDQDEEGKQLCKIHRVPSSPRPALPKSWKNSNIMFGMSTSPDRVLYNLPVWSHWLPSAPKGLDSTSSTAELPLVLLLSPPPNPTEKSRMREALEEAQGLGMNLEMREKESDRFETRYFSLVEEMWKEALKRETALGTHTEWFVFSDDDTFFPDFDSVIRMLSEQGPVTKPALVGALSESTKQVAQWGHISYGGAGIFANRALMQLMNAPDQVSTCLAKFGSAFGGDAMVSHCAALVTDMEVKDILTIEPTLHQLDIRGDGTGWFQSGFLITSLHHWGSWFTLFPPWSEAGSGDLRKGISLVGKAAKSMGGDNWGRRYVFEDGKVVVNLGYSVVVEAKAVTKSDLAKSEHTWWEFETFHPIRDGREEGTEKRTYYLSGVRNLDQGIVRLEHKNREGERVDIIWDGRAGPTRGGKWASWKNVNKGRHPGAGMKSNRTAYVGDGEELIG